MNSLKTFCFSFLFCFPLFAASSYSVPASSSLFISEFGYCATVTNSLSKALFIPSNTTLEFKTFLDKVRASLVPSVGLSLSACSCKTLLYSGDTTSGLKTIDPDGPGATGSFQVYCDMTTDGGGWMLIARSVSGASTAFGWTTAIGSPASDASPFSMGSALLSTVNWSEILFGSYSGGKTWGSYVYRHTLIPANFLTSGDSKYYATGNRIFGTNTTTCTDGVGSSITPTPIVGGNTGFGMGNTLGYTTRPNLYFFRDCQPEAPYGLSSSNWGTGYDDSYGGYLNGLPGMIMVR